MVRLPLSKQSEAGFTLLEVVVALGIACVALVVLLNYRPDAHVRYAIMKEMGYSLATSKVEELGQEAYRSTYSVWPASSLPYNPDDLESLPSAVIGEHWYTIVWTVQTAPDLGTEAKLLRRVVVDVRCEDCPNTKSDVRVVALIGKM